MKKNCQLFFREWTHQGQRAKIKNKGSRLNAPRRARLRLAAKPQRWLIDEIAKMSSDQPTRNVPIQLLPLLLALLAAGLLIAKGWQTGPFGRHQVVALSPQQEAQLGAQAFVHVLQEADVVREGPIVAVVRRIGSRLADASNNKHVLARLQLKPQRFQWEYRVVRSRQVNAFCLPGGKVVVYTGILPVAETEDGLATVLGHEIGHALAHHGAERMAQQQLVQLGQLAIASSLGDLDPRQRREVMALLGAGSQFGILLPFSRKHESEADHIGLLLMAAAGYDPHEALHFWQRMQRMSSGSRLEFTSTHPSHEHRIRDLKHWLAEAEPLYAESDKQRGQRLLPLP
jgi:predicted Zn-dependent protease